MSNINDYLDWRGDITFAQSPFNVVDNLILAELAYTDFGGIVPGPGINEKISLDSVYKKFFELHTEEEIMAKSSETKVAPFLMHRMVKSNRFKNIYLTGYVNEINDELDVQFSVVTFLLDDNTYFVAYRGTDSTIVGWKEDCNMGYLYQTTGQQRAMKYLNDNFSNVDKKIRVGGHSKGGNFAVYASSFCDENIQENIINVYSNDGPGFRSEVCQEKGYQHILPKIISTVPENSIVGMLLSNDIKHNVVKSTGSGMGQHNPMTWCVLGATFEESELASSSVKIDNAVTMWLESLSDNDRMEFIDTLFKPFEAGDITTLDDLSSLKWSDISKMHTALQDLPEDTQALVKDAIKKLMASMYVSFKPNIKAKDTFNEKKKSITDSLNKALASIEAGF